MLHTGILPHHTSWARTLQHLRYVVVDELHTYKGVFGSHVANVLRRLVRVARFHGSQPAAHRRDGDDRQPARARGAPVRRAAEDEVELVDESGAPRGERRFFLFNPPVVNAELGIRASYVKQAVMLATDLVRARRADDRVRPVAQHRRGDAPLPARRRGSIRAPTARHRPVAHHGLPRRLPARAAARHRAAAPRRRDPRASSRRTRSSSGSTSASSTRSSAPATRARSRRRGSASGARGAAASRASACSSRRARRSISTSRASRSTCSARRSRRRASIPTTSRSSSST